MKKSSEPNEMGLKAYCKFKSGGSRVMSWDDEFKSWYLGNKYVAHYHVEYYVLIDKLEELINAGDKKEKQED